MRRSLMLLFALLSVVSPAVGAVRETRFPLRDGKLQIHDLNAVVCGVLDLPNCPLGGEVDLRGSDGPDFVYAVNACLWRGCALSVSGSDAMVRLDTDGADGTCAALRRMTRLVAAEKAPHATAAQARNWGLLLPDKFDPSRPVVILVHGLDADRSDCLPMADLLKQAGHQAAFFSYPNEQPIVDSADLLARSLRDFRGRYPKARIDVVAHSMGGLVARQCIEGTDYPGGIGRLIMIAPPNGGSSWARFRCVLSMEENYNLRRWDPDWHWTWALTEGMGEAGSDLMPGSDFLKQLNARSRRDGVQYTIIAGNRSGVSRVEGNCVDTIANWIPVRARGWWGFGHCYRKLQRIAGNYRTETGESDGPVSIASAKLRGVDDFVIVPADHISLYLPIDGQPPVAWPVVRDRLRD